MRSLSVHCLTLVLALPLLHACNSNCLQGEGTRSEKVIEVSSFNGIEVQGSIDVEVRIGATPSVVILAQPNIAELIQTKVDNGIWSIATKSCYNATESILVRITAPTMDQIRVNGSGDVIVKDPLTNGRLDFVVRGSGTISAPVDVELTNATVQGSGDILLRGKCATLNAVVQGSGDIDASNTLANRVDATVTGSGDIHVHVVEHLNATVVGSGDINYSGAAAHVEKHITGSGSLEHVQ